MNASTTTRMASPFFMAVYALFALVDSAVAQEPGPPKMPMPSKQHKILAADIGSWDATMKIWEKPGGEPLESKATEKCELMRGGFWLLRHFEGQIGPMKYSGIGTFGYDPTEKKYVGTWIDSMNPYMLTMKGDYDEATKAFTMNGQNREPDGKLQNSKEISRHIDDNTRTFELHMQGDDGKFFKMMEINYKRRAGQSPK